MEFTPHNCTRGQIFLANLEPVTGSEQGGKRPVLIIQNDIGNRYSPTVIVAPITTRAKKANLPVHIVLPESLYLPQDSFVLLEQIRTIDKSRLIRYLGTIHSQETMKSIEEAICISIGVNRNNFDISGEQTPKALTLCLCSSCVRQFYNSPYHVVRRIDPLQQNRDTCTYCEFRQGYDYRIIERKKRLGDEFS